MASEGYPLRTSNLYMNLRCIPGEIDCGWEDWKDWIQSKLWAFRWLEIERTGNRQLQAIGHYQKFFPIAYKEVKLEAIYLFPAS